MLYNVTVTVRNGDFNGVFHGLNLNQAIIKIVGNIYGFDDKQSELIERINEDCNTKFGATFFCNLNHGSQVSVKAQ